MSEVGLYKEGREVGNQYRAVQLRQIETLIMKRRKVSAEQRKRYFRPDLSSIEAYKDSLKKYRKDLINMLGWPLNKYTSKLFNPSADIEYVATDLLGTIYRLNIHVMSDVTMYGLLFLPLTPPPWPLVISQHGGMGTPELCSGFFGSDNYNDMTRRILRKNVAVFAPQMLLWAEEFGPNTDRSRIDTELKQLGGSIAALEIFKLKRSIDYLHSRGDIIPEMTGMVGLSYGGFYTLFTAAVDTRIKAALVSCFFNNRFTYAWSDLTWFNSGNMFLDAEVGALVCPRALYIEAGAKDELFTASCARSEYNRLYKIYEALNLKNNLRYKEFQGTHELDKSNEGIDYIIEHLR
jgi:hypothetical protein